jgi:hypothetical protein
MPSVGYRAHFSSLTLGGVAMLIGYLNAWAGANTVTDRASGAMIEPPAGIVVTAGSEIPEWDFKAAPIATGWPDAVGDRGILCALTFSIAPRLGDKVTSAYLQTTVDAYMRAQGAQDPTSTVEEANGRFVMFSRWRPTQGQDAGNVIFMYHAQTHSTYAYMSCVTHTEDAAASKPLFRSIWDGIRLPD